jgi:RluA family pseudouridine synthase
VAPRHRRRRGGGVLSARSKRTAAERWIEHTTSEAEAGRTVQQILTGVLGVSRRQIQKLTRSDGIRLNGRPPFLKRPVRAGDIVAARIAAAEEGSLAPEEMPLDVVHEDADVLVVNKPAGMLVHPVLPDQHGTLAHGIAHHFAEQGLHARVRPVHRLDRDTSGLLVFAKTAHAHRLLDRQIQQGELEREYLALASGVIAEERGVIDAPIARDPAEPRLRAVLPGGAPARTRFEVVERYADATLLWLKLETGRTHQIRVHLTHLGHPLLGDRQYGRVGLDRIGRQALHAARLAFRHPTTDQLLEFEATLPADMAALRERLSG